MDKQVVKENRIYKIFTVINSLINISLFIALLTVGIITKSNTVLFASIDSILDVIVSTILMIVAIVATKKADEKHPYGHERIESVTTLVLALILILTSTSMGHTAIINLSKIITKQKVINLLSNWYGIITISTKLLCKIIIFISALIVYRRIKNISLKAIFMDAIGDIIVSVLSLITLICTNYQMVYFDQIGGLVIAGFILYNGITLLKGTISQIIDQSPKSEILDTMYNLVLQVPGVIAIDLFRTRQFAKWLYVDLEIVVDGHLSVIEGHDIAESVHRIIKDKFNFVKYCMVHVNPREFYTIT